MIRMNPAGWGEEGVHTQTDRKTHPGCTRLAQTQSFWLLKALKYDAAVEQLERFLVNRAEFSSENEIPPIDLRDADFHYSFMPSISHGVAPNHDGCLGGDW